MISFDDDRDSDCYHVSHGVGMAQPNGSAIIISMLAAPHHQLYHDYEHDYEGFVYDYCLLIINY